MSPGHIASVYQLLFASHARDPWEYPSSGGKVLKDLRDEVRITLAICQGSSNGAGGQVFYKKWIYIGKLMIVSFKKNI